MRTWVIKPEFRKPGVWPDDMIVVELEALGEVGMLLYINHDGKWGLTSVSCGYPTAHMFDVYE